MKPEILETIFKLYDCIIIEGFGVGGIPESLLPTFQKAMDSPAASHKLIVMATQVIYEGSRMDIYQVGQNVCKAYPLLETFDMTIEAAVAKLMWISAVLQSDCNNPAISKSWQDTARQLFYEPINHDISNIYLK
jgi:L-asparaginase